jgi:DNA replication and repair protein RecF
VFKVRKLVLKNFRNIRETEFQPDPKLNFLVGLNGQGKTSVLEALGYVATLRSFRGSKAPEVIHRDCEQADIRCEISAENGEWQSELRVAFQMADAERKRAKKTAYINGKAFHSSTQYLSQRFGSMELGFHTVIFNPSDHDLVRGEPSIRRAYLDQVLSAENVEYLRAIQKYQRLLTQRNAILKQSEGSPNPSQRSVLLGFSEQLAQVAAAITFERLSWVKRFAANVNNVMQQIAPNQPIVRVFYASSWVPEIENLCIGNNALDGHDFTGLSEVPSLELLEQVFWKKLSSLESAEWRIGHSLVGPHRDDWVFYLGATPLKSFGSQGEVRSALLALKLSEIELFQSRTGHQPLLLLDDFSSELDRNRRSFLLRYLTETELQVFVTTTEDSVFAGKRFWVSNGQILKDQTSGETITHERDSTEHAEG